MKFERCAANERRSIQNHVRECIFLHSGWRLLDYLRLIWGLKNDRNQRAIRSAKWRRTFRHTSAQMKYRSHPLPRTTCRNAMFFLVGHKTKRKSWRKTRASERKEVKIRWKEYGWSRQKKRRSKFEGWNARLNERKRMTYSAAQSVPPLLEFTGGIMNWEKKQLTSSYEERDKQVWWSRRVRQNTMRQQMGLREC